MAETRNIKELPQSDAMSSGDFFLIESPAGTQLLAYDNFVIDQDNTTFAAELQTNMTTLSTSVTSVSANMDLTGANAGSTLYIMNTSLTERIDSLSNTLYGIGPVGSPPRQDATFETLLQEYRDANSLDPETGEGRDLGSHLQALSAMIWDTVYTKLNSLSANVIGTPDNSITARNLVYDGVGTNTNPAGNSGGLLGVVLDTVTESVDVYVQEQTVEFGFTNQTQSTISVVVPARYTVNSSSLMYNIEFQNPAQIADTGDHPYSNIGSFVVVGYTTADAGAGGINHKWTIQRIGGASWITAGDYPIRVNCKVVAGV